MTTANSGHVFKAVGIYAAVSLQQAFDNDVLFLEDCDKQESYPKLSYVFDPSVTENVLLL